MGKQEYVILLEKYKQQPIRYNPPLTDFNPRLSLLWIAMASSSCRISDSSVVTRSRTSGVLTKRTNLQRVKNDPTGNDRSDCTAVEI
jgi:hypothetical protein